MRLYVLELSSRPHVIRIPWLCDAGVGSPKLTNEGEEPYAIGYRGEEVHLGHALLDVQEVT